MLKTPETRYARRGEGHIAYQVFGDGPIDLVYRPGTIPIDLLWDQPAVHRLLNRLAAFSRVILFDQRGIGASDPIALDQALAVEELGDDISYVLDEVGSDRAALVSEGTSLPLIFFAASHPDRSSALVLANAQVKLVATEDFPWALPPELIDRFLRYMEKHWGDGSNVDFVYPTQRGDDRVRSWLARAERLACSPRVAAQLWRRFVDIDLRPAIEAIRIPTLVIHSRDNQPSPIGQGRYIAEHIEGARLVEFTGADHHLHLGYADELADEIESFLTGVRPIPDAERVLATILFSDISDSTQKSSDVGDRRWRQLLDAHDTLVRQHLTRFRGREIKTTGDGVLATFDGPARAIRCALAMKEALAGLGLEIHCGIHTGEVELRGDDIAGIAVVIASRICDLAQPGEVLVSGTVRDLVAGSGIEFGGRGAARLKGVPDEWRLFSVRS